LYIYSIDRPITEETAPVGCCVLACCQRPGLLSTIIVDFHLQNGPANTALIITSVSGQPNRFLLFGKHTAYQTPRLQFHDVIVGQVTGYSRSLPIFQLSLQARPGPQVLQIRTYWDAGARFVTIPSSTNAVSTEGVPYCK